MKRPHMPFFVILALLLLTFPFSFLFGNWNFPELETRVYPPFFILLFTVLVILLFTSLGYWLSSKRVNRVIWTLFAFHTILTIPTLIFLKFPAIFLDVQQMSIGEILRVMSIRIKLIPASWTLFLTGQVLFLFYYLRTIKAGRRQTDNK